MIKKQFNISIIYQENKIMRKNYMIKKIYI